MIHTRYAFVLAAAGLAGIADRAAAQMAIFPPPNQSAAITRSSGSSGGLFRPRYSTQTWTTSPGYIAPRTVLAPAPVVTSYSAPAVRSVAPIGYTPTPYGTGYTPTPYGTGYTPTPYGTGYTPTPYGTGYTPTPYGAGYKATPYGVGYTPTYYGTGYHAPPPPAAVYYR